MKLFKYSTFIFSCTFVFTTGLEAQDPCIPENDPIADIILTQDFSENWDPNNPNEGTIEEYRPSSGEVDNLLIDGFDAFWVFQNNGQFPNDPTTANPADTGPAVIKTYPIQMYQQEGTFFRRARIQGYTSLSSEWGPTYLNGTAFLVRQSSDVTVEEIRADKVWDGLRSSHSVNTTYRNCWISNIRDDSVENDHLGSLTLENILFENAFVGISMRPSSNDTTSDGTGNLVSLENVHIYLTPYWYNDEQTNATATIFKTSATHVMPQVLIKDCVFGWEVDPTVNNPSNITNILDDIHPDSGNNIALWMSLDPVPDWFYDENVLPDYLFADKLIGQEAINFAENDKVSFKDQWLVDCRPMLDQDYPEEDCEMNVDLSPEIILSDNSINGISAIDVSISISELAGCDTSGEIVLYMNKDARININWDPALLNSNGLTLSNTEWNFDNSNPNYYIWTSSNLINANSTQNIGFVTNLNEAALDGQTKLTVNLLQNSGGDTEILNNVHSVSINFSH